jgi:hypothetical protein
VRSLNNKNFNNEHKLNDNDQFEAYIRKVFSYLEKMLQEETEINNDYTKI